MNNIRLNPKSGTPLYLQLMRHLTHAIESGEIRARERLPSVRVMASSLVINPNTVARAYRDLETAGFVVSRHGAGVYVAESVRTQETVIKKAGPILAAAVDRLEALGINEEGIRRLVETELAQRRAAPRKGRQRA